MRKGRKHSFSIKLGRGKYLNLRIGTPIVIIIIIIAVLAGFYKTYSGNNELPKNPGVIDGPAVVLPGTAEVPAELQLGNLTKTGKYDRTLYEGNKYNCGKTETFREALIVRQGKGKVEYTTAKDGCIDKITGGVTYDPYNDEWIDATSAIDLDHVVPLFYSWKNGAKVWSVEQAYDFGHNMKCYDEEEIWCHMIATKASSNRAKGSKDPSEWLPKANKEKYIELFDNIKADWDLK